MSKRTTIAMAVIAGGLLLYILAYERHTLSSGELSGREGRLLESFVRDRVTKLEIEREGGRVVLERERDEEDELGEWKLVEPVTAEIDFDAVDSLMGALEWADARRTIEGVTAEDRERFGLDEPRLRAWFTVAARRVPIAFGGEDPQKSGLYVQLEDESVAYVVGRDVYEALDHDAGWFRSKEMLASVAPNRAERVTIGGGRGERRLGRRHGRWWIEAPFEGLASAGAVQEMLRKLHELRAARFVDDDPEELSRYGLDEPAHVVHLSRPRADGNETVEATLRIGRPCDEHEGELYARVDEGPVVCVDAGVAEALAKPAEDLRERRLVTARDDEVERVEIRSGNRTLELWREEGAWKLRSRQGSREEQGTADPQGVADFLAAMRDARARGFEEATDAALRERGLTSPTVTLTLHLTPEDDEAERREVAALGRSSAEAAWARRDDEPAILELPAEAAARLSTSPLPFRERTLLDEDDEAATRFVIRRGQEREVVEKRDGEWRVVEPIAIAADEGVMRTLTRGIAELEAQRFVAERPAEEHGLSAPRFVVEASFGDGDGASTHILRIGAPAEDGSFATLGDDPTVFVVDAHLVDEIGGAVADRGALAVPRSEVERLVVERGGSRVEVTPGSAETDEGRLLLDRLATLRAAGSTGYGASSNAAGLSRPRARLTVVRRPGGPEPREVVIVLGAEEDGRVHARRSDLDVGWLLAAEAAAPFLEEQPRD